MASLFELFVKISGDNSSFKKSVKDSQADLAQFETTAEATASRMAVIGTKLMGAIGFASIGAGAIAAASKFNEASVAIQNATGATGERLDSLNKSFTAVYKSVDESSGEVSKTLALLATRSQATGKELEELTRKTLNLAKTQKEDVVAIVPLVTRAFGDWSIATNKQGAAMDYFRAVSQATGSSVASLAETVVYAGAPLRQLGYNFEQSTALIGKFQKEGVNTELVLGGMKAALQKFAKDGVTDTAAAWQEFVAGVRSGNITLQDVMKEVGAKRGVDLYKAITEWQPRAAKMWTASRRSSQFSPTRSNPWSRDIISSSP